MGADRMFAADHEIDPARFFLDLLDAFLDPMPQTILRHGPLRRHMLDTQGS